MALRGGLGSKSKKDKFAQSTEAQNQASNSLLKASEKPAEENVARLIEVSKIIPDERNRALSKLSEEELLTGNIDINSSNYQQKSRFLEGLNELANEIKSLGDDLAFKELGLKQPIEVYKHGDLYKITYGERRYLAHKLLGWENIRAFVLERKPKNLRRIQAAENLQREDVAAWERLINLKDIIAEHEAETGEIITQPEQLMPVINKGKTQCWKYLKLLNLPLDIQKKMEEGIVLSIKLATDTLANLDEKNRAIVFDNVKNQDELLERVDTLIKTSPKEPEKIKSTKVKAGRRRSRISLGTVKETKPIQIIITQLRPELSDQVVDWTDLDQVQSTWDLFLNQLVNS